MSSTDPAPIPVASSPVTVPSVRATKAFHNTVVMTGSRGQGFVCSGCSAAILQLRNNIIHARWKVGYAGGTVDEDYNLFSGGILQFNRGTHSRVSSPGFVSATNLRLRASSPAVDRGVPGLVRVDVRGRRVPLAEPRALQPHRAGHRADAVEQRLVDGVRREADEARDDATRVALGLRQQVDGLPRAQPRRRPSLPECRDSEKPKELPSGYQVRNRRWARLSASNDPLDRRL